MLEGEVTLELPSESTWWEMPEWEVTFKLPSKGQYRELIGGQSLEDEPITPG